MFMAVFGAVAVDMAVPVVVDVEVVVVVSTGGEVQATRWRRRHGRLGGQSRGRP